MFELGFGTGALAKRLLERHLPNDSRYVGLELSPRMHRLAKSRLRPFTPRIELLLSEGSLQLPLPLRRVRPLPRDLRARPAEPRRHPSRALRSTASARARRPAVPDQSHPRTGLAREADRSCVGVALVPKPSAGWRLSSTRALRLPHDGVAATAQRSGLQHRHQLRGAHRPTLLSTHAAVLSDSSLSARASEVESHVV